MQLAVVSGRDVSKRAGFQVKAIPFGPGQSVQSRSERIAVRPHSASRGINSGSAGVKSGGILVEYWWI